MEASGSTPPSARVFRKFDKSRPTILQSTPVPRLYFSSTSQPHRTHIDRPSDEISSSSQSLVIPGAFWAGTRYTPRAFLFETSYHHPPALVIWPESRSTFCFSTPQFASLRGHSRTTYFAVTLFSSSRVGRRTRSRCRKRAGRAKSRENGEKKEKRLIGA